MKRKAFIITALLLCAQLAFIFGNSFLPQETSADMSRGLMAFVKQFLDPESRIDAEVFHHYIRKCAHFFEFALLGIFAFLLRRFAVGKDAKPSVLFFLPPFIGITAAVIDEYIQLFTDRGSEVADVVLDFAGVLFGILLTWLFFRFFHKKAGHS